MTNEFLLLQFHRTRVVGIVVRRSNGGWRVQRDVVVPLDHDADAATKVPGWSARLRQALGGKNCPEACILLLHRRDYAVVRIELPPGTPQETAAMLELNLDDRLPTDSSRICYGWEHVGTGESAQQNIQVCWTPQEKILTLLEELRAGGFGTAGIFPGLSLFRQMLLPVDATAPVAFVHRTTDAVEHACWNAQGAALLSRGRGVSSSPGSNEITKCVDEFMRELAGFAAESGARAGLEQGHRLRVICPDGYEIPARYAHILETTEDAATLRLSRVTAQLKSEGAGDFLVLAAMAELAGGLLGEGQSGQLTSALNMLPRQIVRRHARLRKRSLAFQVSLIVSGIALLAGANLWFYGYRLEQSLKEKQAEIARLAPKAKEIEAMEQRIASIRDQIDYAVSPADALRQVNSVLAGSGDALTGLYLDRMSYKASGEIAMEGHAISDITPWKFAEALDATGHFHIPQRPKIETHMYGGTRSIRFALTAQAGERKVSGGDGKREE